MSRTDTSPRTDGGTASEFDAVANEQVGAADRRREWIEEHVLAPGRVLWSDWRARIAVTVLTGYLLMGAVAWISAAEWGPTIVPRPSPNQGPALVGAFRTLEFPLGTTFSGHSILSQVVHATPAMLKMIGAGAVFTVVVGATLGTVAGYKGGRVDDVVMTLVDVALTIPGLPLIIVLAGALTDSLQGNPYVIGILLSINAWAGLSRAVRSQVLTLRGAEYVEASRVMGLGTGTVLRRDVLPNLMPYVTMNFVKQARAVIYGSVGLYFLGVLPYTAVNWGVMMNNANSQAGAVSSPAAFHWLAVPMVTVILLSLSLTLLAQSGDRLFNPRVRARHVSHTSDAPAGATVGRDGTDPAEGEGPGVEPEPDPTEVEER